MISRLILVCLVYGALLRAQEFVVYSTFWKGGRGNSVRVLSIITQHTHIMRARALQPM